ncbi:class I SAM-dependent methyltransferase [Saccharothrix syringae]|uniref:Class I SAM-dependent methyltransferase n=1 Tax=Saccharothrix syringae TaxID=103733 RepID=A0A5Q0H8U3_SACSY|nr:class I SAM-dependent methyltransferase [Saccharothrix syringae]QFZ22345.1 class I SAM-dependent methyltransferase [Saccharothrix syringae]
MTARGFYDRLAVDYHLLYADWHASAHRQADALDALVGRALGPGARSVLDCACGIGTQAVGLAALGHRVVATDLSPTAAARARREARARDLRLPVAAADMRALPLPAASVEVVVCADNALPHLLTAADVRAALAEMHRVLVPGGLLVVSTRPYDEIRATRPPGTPPHGSDTPAGRVVTFQLWHWHDDGEHYDLELFRVAERGGAWETRVDRTTYWALGRDRLAGFAAGVGLVDVAWHEPGETGFFQPLLTARKPAGGARSLFG